MEKYRKFADAKSGVNPFQPLNIVRLSLVQKFLFFVKFIFKS